MSFRPLIVLGLALALSGCASEAEKQKKETAEKEKDASEKLQRMSEEPGFVAFVGRLRTAVANKDLPTLSSMMTNDFGYRWDTAPVGDNIFTYWDMNARWPILAKTLRENFVPNRGYMVAPAAAVTDPNYRGFRAGLRQINGSWRFAYFVPTEGVTAP